MPNYPAFRKRGSVLIGRPELSRGEAKTKIVRARVTPSELKAIKKAANGDGVSEWARTVTLRAAQ